MPKRDNMVPYDDRLDTTNFALLKNDVSYIKDSVKEIKSTLGQEYVTKDSMALLKDKIDRLEKIIYGVIMAILLALIGGITFFR